MKYLSSRRSVLGVGLCLALASLPGCGKDAKAAKDEDDDKDKKRRRKKKRSEKKRKKKTMLERLAAFEKSKKKQKKEPYDSILLRNKAAAANVDSELAVKPKPLPPTLTDVLLEDMKIVAKRLKLEDVDKTLSRTQLGKLVAHYHTTPPGKLAGFRPYTHQEFIASLDEGERSQLIDELAAHLKSNGGFAKMVFVPEHEK